MRLGFRLVRVLESAEGPLPLKELSERAGMPPAKAYAYGLGKPLYGVNHRAAHVAVDQL